MDASALNTLSDTAWGAILILMTTMTGSAITYLMLYVRSLNKTILDITDKRTNDAKEMYEASQKLTRESLTTVDKASRTIDLLGVRIVNVETAIGRLHMEGHQ